MNVLKELKTKRIIIINLLYFLVFSCLGLVFSSEITVETLFFLIPLLLLGTQLSQIFIQRHVLKIQDNEIKVYSRNKSFEAFNYTDILEIDFGINSEYLVLLITKNDNSKREFFLFECPYFADAYKLPQKYNLLYFCNLLVGNSELIAKVNISNLRSLLEKYDIDTFHWLVKLGNQDK